MFKLAVLVLLAGNLVVGSLLVMRALPRRCHLRPGMVGDLFFSSASKPTNTPDMALAGVTAASAIETSIAFLQGRLRSGDYGLTCTDNDGRRRFSDNKGHIFVAAFVTEALAGRLSEIDRALILSRILSEENDGQWGYSPPGPRHNDQLRVFHVDSDDTAYVIRTLRRLGVNRPPECLLPYFREKEGLFVTFNAQSHGPLTTSASPANNFSIHPEVNANIFLALRETHLESFANEAPLAQAQDGQGFWESYFYPGQLFGTLLAIDALKGSAIYADAVERGLAFVAGCQNADGSWGSESDPYETALALSALAGHAPHAAAIARGIDYLLSTMRPDGSWGSSACIWEFHAGPSDVLRAYDMHGTYVSARCTIALRRATGDISASP